MTCGTGGFSGPQPGDPDNSSVLTAQATWGGINVRWSLPGVNPSAVSYTRLYRSLSNVFATAYLYQEVGGGFFFDQEVDQVNPTTYYYWIEIVSIYGTVNNVIGPASATTFSNITQLIDRLTGYIDQNVLATALSTEINQINLNKLNITQELLDRAASDDALAASYSLLEAFTDETRALLEDEVLARTTADSAIVTQVTTLWAEVDDAVAAVQVETQARVDADGLLATQITTTQTTLEDNIASVQVTLQSNIDVIDGVVTEIGALYTVVVDVNGYVGGFGIYNTGSTVQAGFNVDLFWIGKPGTGGAPGVYPFIVSDGVVYMKSAMIAEASIDSAKIANAAITTAKIDDAAITSAKIGTLAVDTMQIAGSAVIVPVYAEFSGEMAIPSSYGEILSATMTIPTTGISSVDSDIPVAIFWSVETDAENSGANRRSFRIVQSSTEGTSTLYESFDYAKNFDQFCNGSVKTLINAGVAYTWALEVWDAESGNNIYRASLFTMGLRR